MTEERDALRGEAKQSLRELEQAKATAEARKEQIQRLEQTAKEHEQTIEKLREKRPNRPRQGETQ